jgi:hypothetical protein
MDTGDTVTVQILLAFSRRLQPQTTKKVDVVVLPLGKWDGIPDGEDTSSLGKTSFLLDTSDSLLKD